MTDPLKFPQPWPMTFTQAAYTIRKFLRDGRHWGSSHSSIETTLRSALNSGQIDGRKRRGRWEISEVSVLEYCDEVKAKHEAQHSRITWATRARLMVGTLLRDAMEAKGRECSWPFDSMARPPKDELDALWAGLVAELKRLESRPFGMVDEDSPAWVRLALKMPPKLAIVPTEEPGDPHP